MAIACHVIKQQSETETESLVGQCRHALESHFPTMHVGNNLCVRASVSTDSMNDCIIHHTNLSLVSTLSDQPTLSFLFYSFVLWCVFILLVGPFFLLCRDNIIFENIEVLVCSFLHCKQFIKGIETMFWWVWISIVEWWFQGRKQGQNVLLVHVIWPDRETERQRPSLQIWKSKWALIQRLLWDHRQGCMEAKDWHKHTVTPTNTHTGVITDIYECPVLPVL